MKSNRTLVGAVAIFSLFTLMGAKGQGCGGTVETDEEPICAPGTHLEEVCAMLCAEPVDSSGSGDSLCEPQDCEEQCVPDAACPDGYVEQEVCSGPYVSDSGSDIGCAQDGTGCLEPPTEEECWIECVPVNPCGEGFIEVTRCEDDVVSSGSGVDCADPSSDCAPPPESCWTECVPVGPCPAGYHEETICAVYSSDSGSGDEPLPPEECYTECVPDQVCGPDEVAVEVCEISEPGDERCWTECEPIYPSEPEEPQAS